MAEGGVSVDQDQFMCPVCLDLLKEPVTIPCGHSYCMTCITDCWDHDDQKGIYSCPLCKQTFTPRPVLAKNVVFAQMVEKLRKTIPQTAAPEVHHAGPGDVQCDACSGNKQKAVKSCQECRNSYCQDHLDHHERLFRGRGHNLMDATGRLQDMICPQHNKMLEIYCRTDQRCICVLCLVDEHKNHDTISIAAERKEKQKYLLEAQVKIQNVIKQREKDLLQLREALDDHERSAQKAVEDSERIFTELIREIEKRRSEVNQLIRDQERAAVSRAEEHLERLKQEIHDLKRRNTELTQLSGTQDHLQFLQSLSSVSLSGSTDSGFTVSSHLSFDDVVKSASQFRDKLLQIFKEETIKISKEVKAVQVIQIPEFQTREEFLQYAHLLTLDLNSMHDFLHLSEGNTVITVLKTRQRYPDHPDRFDHWWQALCRETVMGRCYLEVEWAGQGRFGVDISVTYKSIRRKEKGREGAAGLNNLSWRLFCSPYHCSFWHNNTETVLPVVSSRRIGVYVDHSAGVLSFYSISETMSLIHRVQTTFTQPLYAVFGFDSNSSLKLCRLNN